MATGERPAKLTIVLDDRDLCHAIKAAAIERDQPVRAIVAQALREWLERHEELEDLRAIEEAIKETGDDPGVPWEEMKRQMRE